MKIGIFGGSFNPPHQGHLNAMNTIKKVTGLEKVIVIPTAQNPLKAPIDSPTSQQRIAMTKLMVEQMGKGFEIDDQEIRRGGLSYTIDTLQNLNSSYGKNAQFYLILGIDKLNEFESWRKPLEILDLSHIIFTSRPGFELPKTAEDLPPLFKNLVVKQTFNKFQLKSGKEIEFVQLKDVEASSSQLRKWIRGGKNIEKYVPPSVANYIRAENVYRGSSDKIGNFKDFTHFCAQGLYAKKAIGLKAFSLEGAGGASSDYVIVASGTNTRHTTSLGENLYKMIKEEYGVLPQSFEGTDEGRWVLLDYGNLIVHIFYDFIRSEYALESLWMQGTEIVIEDAAIPNNINPPKPV
jgi:nicotinate-nucleotide adenylyltransferase